MSIQDKIDDILTQLCNSNNHNLECIKEMTIESYMDVSNTDLPIMVRISSDYSLLGVEDAEGSICDMLLDLAHSGINWRYVISKITIVKVTIIEQEKEQMSLTG